MLSQGSVVEDKGKKLGNLICHNGSTFTNISAKNIYNKRRKKKKANKETTIAKNNSNRTSGVSVASGFMNILYKTIVTIIQVIQATPVCLSL